MGDKIISFKDVSGVVYSAECTVSHMDEYLMVKNMKALNADINQVPPNLRPGEGSNVNGHDAIRVMKSNLIWYVDND